MDNYFKAEGIWRSWGKYRVREDRLEYTVADIIASEDVSVMIAGYLFYRLREWQHTGR